MNKATWIERKLIFKTEKGDKTSERHLKKKGRQWNEVSDQPSQHQRKEKQQ
jgi:hypothetical protein